MCRASTSQLEIPYAFTRPVQDQRFTAGRVKKAVHQPRRLPREMAVILGGQDYDGLFAASGHQRRALFEREIHDLTESALGLLELPGVHDEHSI